MIGRMIFLEFPAMFMSKEEEDREKLGTDPIENEGWGSDVINIRIEIGTVDAYWPYKGAVTLQTHFGKFRINMPIEEFDMIIAENTKLYNGDFIKKSGDNESNFI